MNYVTWLLPNCLQVVLSCYENQLVKLVDQMQEHYNKLPPGAESLMWARLGDLCVAQYSEDKYWYRAVITGILQQSKHSRGLNY